MRHPLPACLYCLLTSLFLELKKKFLLVWSIMLLFITVLFVLHCLVLRIWFAWISVTVLGSLFSTFMGSSISFYDSMTSRFCDSMILVLWGTHLCRFFLLPMVPDSRREDLLMFCMAWWELWMSQKQFKDDEF